jgi:hypothetical protein
LRRAYAIKRPTQSLDRLLVLRSKCLRGFATAGVTAACQESENQRVAVVPGGDPPCAFRRPPV